MPNIEQKIYIHQNYKKNEIREVLLQNSNTSTRPDVDQGSDKGLLYYDIDINRVMVWDGNCWRIVQYLDDRDFDASNDVKLQDIWADSRQLESLSITQSQTTNPYVEYHEDVELTHITGSTDFYNNSIDLVVTPRDYIDGSTIPDFYEPILKKYNGDIIPRFDSGKEIWRLIEIQKEDWNISYRIRFLNGFPSGVSGTNKPTLTYYEYIGNLFDVSVLGGSINKQLYNASNGTQLTTSYELPLLPGLSSEQEVVSISLNGVELPHTHYEITGSGSKKLVIDTDGLGYDIDTAPPEDLIYVNFTS